MENVWSPTEDKEEGDANLDGTFTESIPCISCIRLLKSLYEVFGSKGSKTGKVNERIICPSHSNRTFTFASAQH